MIDLTTAEGVAAYMRESTSVEDWNNRIEHVKNANDGQYPSFWWETIVMSGLAEEVANGFGMSAKIEIITKD